MPSLSSASSAHPLLSTSHPCPHVVLLTLNRPSSRNAFNAALYTALTAALALHSTSRVIVLSGAGATFSAGMDIKEASTSSRSAQHAAAKRLMIALIKCPALVIVAAHGACVGIGVTLLLHADVVYLADGTRLSTPFSALGIPPEFGSSLLFPRRLGTALTVRLLYDGGDVGAEEMRRVGFAEDVSAVGAEGVLGAAVERAAKISGRSGDEWEGVAAAKKMVRSREMEDVLRAVEDEFVEIEESYRAGRPGRLIQFRVREIAGGRERQAML